MRTLCSLAAMALALTFAGAVRAEEEKVTLKGELSCAKCIFKVDGVKECTNAIKVKTGDKEVIYLIDDGGTKAKYHGEICKVAKPATVAGVVSKKGDEMHIKPDTGGVKIEAAATK